MSEREDAGWTRGAGEDAGGTDTGHHRTAVKIENTLRKMRSLRWRVNDFRFLQTLGYGRASTVYRAVHVTTGMEFAIKKCHAAKMTIACERLRLEKEIAVHSNLFHPAITTFYGSFTDQQGNVYIILEYAKRRDLFNLLYSTPVRDYDDNSEDHTTMTEVDICERVLGPLISAVAYLHDRDIIHRDIKPENLILSNESNGCKLADFGFAVDTSRDNAVTRWGPKKSSFLSARLGTREMCFFPDVFAVIVRKPGTFFRGQVYPAPLPLCFRPCVKSQKKKKASASHLMVSDTKYPHKISHRTQKSRLALLGAF